MSLSLARSVTFGDSGLDRAANLRVDPAALAALRGDARARVLPLWHGKPLVQGEADVSLGWLGFSQAGLEPYIEAATFLGLDDDIPRFAIDMTRWEPPLGSDARQDAFSDDSEQLHPDFPPGHRFVELRRCMADLSPREGELAATARGLVAWHARHRFCANCGALSDVVQAGWQRLCASCGAHHFPRTDPVVIMLITRGNNVLLGRAPIWPEGMFSLLAGFVEPGETIEAAVRREVFEETAVRVGPVSYLVSQPWPFPASLMLACRGEALSEEITIDPVELDEALWLSREDMLRVLDKDHAQVRAPRRGSIARFVLERWVADRLDEPMS